jgi:hypothetical protein
MSIITKFFAIIVVSSIAFVQSLFADEAPQTVWEVTEPNASGVLTITEVVPAGQTPWKFTLTKAGQLDDSVQGTGSILNFRTISEYLPEGCEDYVIKNIYSKKGASPFSNNVIIEIYWPDTITTILARTYYQCTKLKICDYPEGTKITSIGEYAFGSCTSLTRFRISHDLQSVAANAFSSCSKIVFDGPMLPNSLKTINNQVFHLGEAATPLQDGLLVIGGSDDGDFTWNTVGNSGYYNWYFYCFNITNLVFGAGVSEAGINTPRNDSAGNPVYKNPYKASTTTGSSITNIVVRNPGVFAFGSIFNQEAPTTVRNYDVAGWVTGRLVKRTAALAVTVPEARQETAKSYQTRIMAAKNIYWKEFKKARDADNSKYYTPWSELSSDVQQAYWDNFNGGNVGSGDAVPLGLTKGISSYSLTLEGEEPFDPLTIPDNVWIVFKEGSWPGAGLKIIVR